MGSNETTQDTGKQIRPVIRVPYKDVRRTQAENPEAIVLVEIMEPPARVVVPGTKMNRAERRKQARLHRRLSKQPA